MPDELSADFSGQRGPAADTREKILGHCRQYSIGLMAGWLVHYAVSGRKKGLLVLLPLPKLLDNLGSPMVR